MTLEWSDFGDDEHAKAPQKHAPNVVAHQAGQVGMSVQEQHNEDGWMYSDNIVEIER